MRIENILSRFPSGIQIAFAVVAALLFVLSLAASDVRIVYLFLGIATVFFGVRAASVGVSIWRRRSSLKNELIFKGILAFMLLFFFSGAFLYCRAFHCMATDEPGIFDNRPVFVNAEYLFRSMVESLELFMFDIDGNVFDNIGGHPWLKGLLSVQAVLSFLTTLSFIVSLLYSRAKAYWRLRFRTRISPASPELYVFFGVNDQSLLLARDIVRTRGKRGNVLFLETNRASDDGQGGVASILNFFTSRGETFREVEEVGGRLILIDETPSEASGSGGDVLSAIGADMLRRLILKLQGVGDSASLHLFFLSDDEKQNVGDVLSLRGDETIKSFARVDKTKESAAHVDETKESTARVDETKESAADVDDTKESAARVDETIKSAASKGVKVRFYCHARKNGPNRVIQDDIAENMEVRIIDSSALAVETLKLQTRHHPVNFVRLSRENPGTVESEFSSMIIGFDEVGQDALGFLCEFGTFVDYRNDISHGYPSPFHCCVVDTRMKSLSGDFLAWCPQLRGARNTYGSAALSFVEADCRSTDFFSQCLTPEKAAALNYVIIALGNDELGITLASRIFNEIRKYKSDMTDVHILVRCYSKDNYDLLRRTARHLNEGLRKSVQILPIPDVIEIFGAPEQLYTYSMIVEDRDLENGLQFFAGYQKVSPDKPQTWEERRRSVLSKERPRLDVVRELRRKQMQDKANSLHIPTKGAFLFRGLTFLAAEACCLPRNYREDFISRISGPDGKVARRLTSYGVEYTRLTERENLLMLNLAKLEHLRWNASHAMLGYSTAPSGQTGCDERRRTHNCLRPWHLLDRLPETSINYSPDSSYRLYDYVVVDTTIRLIAKQLRSPKRESNHRIPDNFRL